jgi:hypothetical protein
MLAARNWLGAQKAWQENSGIRMKLAFSDVLGLLSPSNFRLLDCAAVKVVRVLVGFQKGRKNIKFNMPVAA